MLPALLAAAWTLPQLALPLQFDQLLRLTVPSAFASAFASASVAPARSPLLPFTMATPLPPCTDSTVELHLRAWLDRIPQRPDGALPPGVVAPPAPPRSPETHALNVELSLINRSSQTHSARVLNGRWSQGAHKQPLHWGLQPDLSPLNRFSVIERQLIRLTTDDPVRVDLDLDLDGRRCRLVAWTEGEVRPERRPQG